MHRYDILPIGTRIDGLRQGYGYILGNAHLRENIYRKCTNDPTLSVYYLTYFPAYKSRRYLSQRHFNVIESATDANREAALSYLPLVVNPVDIIFDNKVPTESANYQFGDWISAELFGNGIILSDGFYRPEQSSRLIYHHVYFPKTGVFEFERERYQTLVKLADDKSRQYAKDVIRNQILTPAFN